MAQTTMGVKLDKETRARLKALGSSRDRTPHYLMKQAINQFLEREEAYEAEKQEDLQRWERYQATGEYVSHDDAKAHFERLVAKARNQETG